MADGQGHDFVTPPPVEGDAEERVVEAPQGTRPDREAVLHVTSADGAEYSVLLPSLRNARKPPHIDATELPE